MKNVMVEINFGNQVFLPFYALVLLPDLSRVGLVLIPEEGKRRNF